MRPVEMPRHRDFRSFDACLAQRRDRLPHLVVDGGVALGMTEPLLQDADAQSLRRLLQRRHIVAGTRGDGPRIPAVMAGDNRQQPRDVLDAGAHRTAMIDRIADRHRSRRRHQAPGRLEPVHAAPARRRADRAALVAAERHRHFAGSHQRSTSARRSAGAMGRVMRVADDAARTRMACAGETEILAGGLAGDSAAGIEDSRHHRGVELGHITFEQRGAVHHGNAGHADVVLDRDFLAAQQAIAAGLDVRLPVPGAIGIFGRRRPIARRPRRDRCQRWRDELLELAIGSERPLEGLLVGGDFVRRQHEAKIRGEPIDLLQRRKTNRHAYPLVHKRKKPPVARKGSEWQQCRRYRWSRRFTLQGETLSVRHSDGVGFARTLSPCTYLRTSGLCLSLAGLVNQTLAPFLSGDSPKRAQAAPRGG